MKRRISNICTLLFCSLLTACFGGVFYIDLGNDYAWLEERYIYKIKEKKGNSIYGEVIIYPQVLNYDYDDKYIIVYQVYDGSPWYHISSQQDKKEKDSLLLLFKKQKEIKYCYWIIDKETDKVLGPMRKPEFDRKCEKMNIKAKMRRLHEKKFWEGRSWDDIDPDSSQRRSLDSIEIANKKETDVK